MAVAMASRKAVLKAQSWVALMADLSVCSLAASMDSQKADCSDTWLVVVMESMKAANLACQKVDAKAVCWADEMDCCWVELTVHCLVAGTERSWVA